MPGKITELQLGKAGITENFIATLKSRFDKNKNIKISVLRSARENKEQVKKLAEEIVEKLGGNYNLRVLGFTIILKKQNKNSKKVFDFNKEKI